MEMKNMAYWKAKNAATTKSAPTRWINLVLGAAKAVGGAVKEHKDRKDALKREAGGANARAVSNMPKFGG